MILVTGITGNSGSFFTERLIRENFQDTVRCTVREKSDTTLLDNSPLHVEKVYGKLDDDEFLDKAMSGVDAVLHIVEIHWSRKIVQAAIRNGVKWIILIHTTGMFSRYESASAEYKRIEEDILRMRGGIAITILRPTMIYGCSRDRNMHKLIEYLYRHRFFPMFGKGENLMQPVHARDLGNAYYDVLTHREATANREYNLSGQYPIKYVDVIRIISKALSKKVTIIFIPMWLSLTAAKIYNFIFGKRALVNVEQVMRLNEDKAFSHEDAARDFGFSPVGFEEGIIEEVRQFLQSARDTPPK